jgi:thiol-disulfide isomerase/thioredoxin
MKKTAVLLLLISYYSFAQTIQGTFPQLKNNEIVLKGYDGFVEKELAQTISDSLGNFILNCPKNYIGAAMLQPKGVNSLIILLNHENFQMQWNDLQDFKTLQFTNSPENEAFAQVITLNQETEPKLAALKYLLPQYQKHPKEYKWLSQEIKKQENRFPAFIKSLPANSYAAYYLQMRKLVMDMPLTANRYIERLPQHEKDFTAINFNDDRLWASGLLGELLDGFYQLMESHLEIEKVTKHCNLATDAWIKSLANNLTKQQVVAEHCFKWLEKRSLFGAAEHLAKAMLNQTNCQLDEKRTNLFEQYRKMGIGNSAPNISLDNKQDKSKNKDLKSINSTYKLVVFGASWCPNCQKDYPKWKENYAALKEKYDLEIVYISIDTEKKVFEDYYKEASFITFCDYKGWETQAAKSYYVFATPTYILLNKEFKIVAKIKSPEHLQAWLEANHSIID